MLCIVEQPKGGKGTDEKVEIGIVSIDPQTGATIYDDFEDGHIIGTTCDDNSGGSSCTMKVLEANEVFATTRPELPTKATK